MKKASVDRRDAQTDPPYLRIVAEIRRRIADGELRAGDRVPTTRQIARDWGVAIATATKALTTLRHEQLIRAMPRVGAVVAASGLGPTPPARAPRQDTGSGPELTRERIVRAAIAIADTEGLQALSMRGVAARLDVPTMSLYRHVHAKDALLLLMTDAVFGEPELPAKPPPGWRARLELGARLQWALYRRHPWLAQVLTLTRPLPLRNVITHAEWSLRAVDGLGLDAETRLHVHMTMFNYVRGIAMNLESEIQAEAETGITGDQWADSQVHALAALAASGSFPSFARLLADLSGGYELDLDKLLDFGLQPLLDGLARLIERHER